MFFRLFAIVPLFLLYSASSAQDVTAYRFLQDDSLLKQQYLSTSLKKKEQLFAALGKEYARDYKEIYQRQFTGITEIWSSNRPVTEARAHQYLQSIVGRIIAGNPELKGNDARVVFSRDWWPNAVSMGDGTILINAGLVTGLDNEAEMAFVICHELAHYYLEHTPKSISKWVKLQNSEEFKAEIKRLSKEEYRVNQQLNALLKGISFDTRRHSRENENEADRFAFHFLKNSGYDCEAVNTCLDKLDKIDDKLFISPVNLESVFNFTSYPFNKKWIREETAIFSAMKPADAELSPEQKDSLKTHPDCTHRKAMLADSISTARGRGVNFLVDSAYLVVLKHEFTLEIMEQSYRDENLGRNLYFAITYLNTHPDDPLAVYSIARALNDLYLVQRDHKLGFTIDSENRSNPAEYNKLLRMLSKIRLNELSELAWHFARQNEPFMKTYPGYADLVNTALNNRQ